MGGGTQTLERPVADLETSQGERRYAHYVDKDKMADAYVYGTALQALCGYVWVPSRDPAKFPVCPECQRLFDLGPEGRVREQKERAHGATG